MARRVDLGGVTVVAGGVPEDLTREELWAIVVALRAELAAAQVKIGELEARLAATSRNSAKPPPCASGWGETAG